MKLENITVSTKKSSEFIDITDKVKEVVRGSGVSEGMCHVFIPHTTAGITINESADPSVRKDIIKELDKIVPLRDNYSHAEGNSAAHIKSTLVGVSLHIPVSGGSLNLGTWQAVYFCEFDGPRSRHVQISVYVLQ
jgi:secondary thiamine-phosphate synthase enzyme